jgi:hypothetical protein
MTSARASLFQLPPDDTSYYFRATLPGDNFLAIQFGKLSYWQQVNLREIFKLAKEGWGQVHDSFTGSTTARRLSIRVPPSNYPVIADIAEWGKEERVLILKGKATQSLRIAVDTINILKTYPSTSKDTSYKPQVQYTFLLKDLTEIDQLASHEQLIARIEHAFDSLVGNYRQRWKRQDAPFHSLQASFDARKEHNGTLHTTQVGRALNNLNADLQFGVSFLTGNIASYANASITYQWKEKRPSVMGFVGLSLSTLSLLREENNSLQLKALAFLNFEMGTIFRNSSRMPLYRTSVGIGFRIAQNDPGPYDFRYHSFFSYSIFRAVTISPDFYIIPKKDDVEAKVFGGITVALRIY